jgi:hypothetical protein
MTHAPVVATLMSRPRSNGSQDTQEVAVAKFMDVHSGFVGVTAQQLKEAHERDLATQGEDDVVYERAWMDPVSGKVFCLATGPDRDAVRRVHERAGHPTSEIYELLVEV